MKNIRFWIPTIVGTFVTPLLMGLVVVAAGAGHGSYFPMFVVYPISFLLLLLQPHNLNDAFLQQILENSLIALAIGVAVIQFPLYGFMISYAKLKKDSAFLQVCKVIVWQHVFISVMFLPIILAGMVI